MHFYDYHNHKWAKNLTHARALLEKGDQATFYRGEDLPEGDVYPGMKVMAAYWISVEHEMIMRKAMLLKGIDQKGWGEDDDTRRQLEEYAGRFWEDMNDLVAAHSITTPERMGRLFADHHLPETWVEDIQTWQERVNLLWMQVIPFQRM